MDREESISLYFGRLGAKTGSMMTVLVCGSMYDIVVVLCMIFGRFWLGECFSALPCLHEKK